MDNEKTPKPGMAMQEDEFNDVNSTRARNRTVMLTPEITGQVRARLAQELGGPAAPQSQTGTGEFTTPTPQGGGRSGAFLPPPATPPASGSMVRSAEGGHSPSQSASYAAPAPQPPASGVVRSPAKVTPLVGFLVSYDSNPNGEVFELRSGRLIVTSEDTGSPGSAALVIRDETVSPMHAILRISQAGEIQVLDQLSEHGTRIRRFGSQEEEELSGEKGSLEHGDEIKFGNRKFHVCLIVRGEGE